MEVLGTRREILIADVRQDWEGDGQGYQVMIRDGNWGGIDVCSWRVATEYQVQGISSLV